MKNRIEILAPAGSIEALKAAAAAGADAVYFGGSGFNARRNADNFSYGDIGGIVSFCHIRGIKAYLTLNTIVFEDEIKNALELAFLACDAGIDAVILQDAGLASLIHRAAPKLKLHASTQMTAHNKSGVRELYDMGFSRVVLARELSFEEIKAIAAVSPVELEVFVHGAHCMSMSGQCYMSAFFGGSRSGNRGLCAQPCRLPFSVGKYQHVLSLKDMSSVQYIQKLSNAGIFSAKIEGRMKRPEYVFASVGICRKAADGDTVNDNDMQQLKAVFSRSGFTKGYLESKLDRDMFGTREYEDIKSSPYYLKRFSQLYNHTDRHNIMVNFKFSVNAEGVELTASDINFNTATVRAGAPQRAVAHGTDEEKAKASICKTGGTPFFPGTVETEIEPGFAVPVSVINSLRREALKRIAERRGNSEPIHFDNCVISEYLSKDLSTEKSKTVENLRLRFRTVDQVPDTDYLSGTEMIIIPLEESLSEKAVELVRSGFKVAAEIPRAVFSGESGIIEKLRLAEKSGIKDAVCGNVGAVRMAEEAGLNIHGDFGLNVSNGASLYLCHKRGFKSCVISFETPIREITKAAENGKCESGIIVYGRLPLMLVRNCPVRSFRGCSGGPCDITDRKNVKFPLVCSNGAAEILNSRPLWLCDKKKDIAGKGLDFFELYFTVENVTIVKNIIRSWKNGSSCGEQFTRGLYFSHVT